MHERHDGDDAHAADGTRPAGLGRLFRYPRWTPGRARREVDDEIAFHLAARTDDLVAQGVAPPLAAAQARREFGDVDAARTALHHDGARAARLARRRSWAAGVADDLRHAARALHRAPGFTLVVTLTLALGLGANAVMLALLDRLLLRDAPGVVEPARVVRVYGRNGWTALTRSWPDYLDLRTVPALSHVAAYQAGREVLQPAADVRTPVRVQRVTAGWFATLGVRAARGRTFAADEAPETAGGEPARVAVIGDRLWARAFARDPGAVGRAVRLGRDTYRVVGVAPPGFRGVDPEPADLWVPLAAPPRERGNYGAVHVVARLAPGATLAAADRAANLANRRGIVAEGLEAPEDKMQLGALSLTRGPAAPKEVRVAAWLGALAGLVLLAAVANVAHLLLARGVAHARETAVRAALGAGRARLARQWVVQGVLLAALGGTAALVAALVLAPVLLRLVLPDAEWAWDGAATDGRAGLGALLDAARAGVQAAGVRPLVAVLLLTLAVGLACGLVPAAQAARRDLASALRGASAADRHRRGAGRHAHRLRGLLLLTQVACTAVLLVAAGLFVRSLHAVRTVDLGFDADRLAVVRVVQDATRDAPPGADATTSAAREAALLDRLRDAALAVPGVAAATAVHTVPFQSAWRTRLHVPGRDPERWGDEGGGRFNFLSTFVDTAYRHAAGLQLVAGRWLDAGDRAGAAPVAVVNEVLAREVWPAATPAGSVAAALGRCVQVVAPGAPCTRIVGVVRATRVESVFDDAPAQYYLPLAQPRRDEAASAVLVRVRAAGGEAPSAADVAGTAARLQRRLAPLLPTGLAVEVEPLAAALDPVRRPWEVGARVFTVFGALVLLVALVGLYSVAALLVAERTPEIGVRRALGATAGDVRRFVARAVAPLLAVGVLVGLAGGWAAARVGRALLHGVEPLDVPTFVAVAAVLGAAGALACLGPLRRALRVSPLDALRRGA